MGKHRRFKSWNQPQHPNCHGCVRRQSVMKCMTSRCAAWFIKDDVVWKPLNKWGNLRRIPFKAEHSNTKCFSSPTPCIHSGRKRPDRGIPARRADRPFFYRYMSFLSQRHVATLQWVRYIILHLLFHHDDLHDACTSVHTLRARACTRGNIFPLHAPHASGVLPACMHSSFGRTHTRICMDTYKHAHPCIYVRKVRPTRIRSHLIRCLRGRAARVVAYYIRCLRERHVALTYRIINCSSEHGHLLDLLAPPVTRFRGEPGFSIRLCILATHVTQFHAVVALRLRHIAFCQHLFPQNMVTFLTYWHRMLLIFRAGTRLQHTASFVY